MPDNCTHGWDTVVCTVCQIALGFELWSVSADILFDNIIITDEKQVAEDWAEQSWVIKRDHELAGVASAVSCSVSLPYCQRPYRLCLFHLWIGWSCCSKLTQTLHCCQSNSLSVLWWTCSVLLNCLWVFVSILSPVQKFVGMTRIWTNCAL